MKSKGDVDIAHLANAVALWLSYKLTVGREYILGEGSIRNPVAEYLEGSGARDIQLEYRHPKLSSKRLDLHFSEDPKTETASIQRTAFEFKYVKDGSTRVKAEKQRVFNDLMRLSLFLDTDHRSFFLICGTQVDFKSDFQYYSSKEGEEIQLDYKNTPVERPTPVGFYNEWFSFDIVSPDKVIDLDSNKNEYQVIYQEFLSKYKEPYHDRTNLELSLPKTICTRLIYLPALVDHPTIHLRTAAIGVWEVLKDA